MGTLFIDSSYSTDVAFVSRQWDMGDGSDNTIAEFIHKYDTNGLYKVKLVRSINDLCSDSFEMDLEVHPQPATSFIQFGYCEYDSVTLVSQSSIVNGNISQIEWEIEEIGILNGDEITVKFNSFGTKQVKVKSFSSQGCIDSSNQNIFVYRKPKAEFSVNAFCANDSSLVSDLSDFYEDTYVFRKWNFQNDSVNHFDGEWEHIVVIRNGTGASIYVNGILSVSNDSLINGLESSGVPNFGDSYITVSMALFDLDEARFYNRTLTPDEISEIYNSGLVANSSLLTDGLV